jgi:hypothetical protein
MQPALKHHRIGLDINNISKGHEHHSVFKYPTAKRLYSLSEARIVSTEILIRVQEWHSYSAEVLTRGFRSDIWYPLYLGCFHVEDGSANRQLEKMLMYRSANWELLKVPDIMEACGNVASAIQNSGLTS